MSTTTDQEANRRTYDAPGSADSDPLKALHNAPATGDHDALGVDPEKAKAEASELDRLFDASPDTPGSRQTPEKSLDAAALKEAEEAAEQPEEPLTDDMLGKGFTGWNKRRQARGLAKMITKRRAFVAGGVSALLGFGGVGLFIGGLPATQAYNYSQILLSANHSNEQTNSVTLSRVYRYMRTGKVGTTRLSMLEYKMYPKFVTSLESTGVKILSEGLTGQIRAVSIDPSKLSDLRGMSREEVARYVSERYGADPAKIHIGTSSGSNVRFSMQDLPLKQRELLLKDIVRQNGSGKVNSAIQMRLLRKYYGVPSMFHPIQRSAASLDQKTLEILRKSKSFRELEKNRTAKIAARNNAAKARLINIKTAATSAAGAASAALLAQGAICVAYDIAKDADVINQENFRDPAVKSGVDGQAVGEQIAADSPDVTKEAVEAYVDNMTDPTTKTTPFDAEAIQALQGKTGGIPTDPALKAAFSQSNSAAALKKNLEENFHADTVCSAGGQIVGAVSGVALVIIGPGGWIMKGITTAASAAATQVAVNFIQSTVPKLIAEEPPIGIPHSGAVGGMFDAYGAKAAANEIAASAGGSTISASTALLREREWQEQDKQSWANLPFTARLFNAWDYRSLSGRFIDSQQQDIAFVSANSLASLLSPVKTLASFSAALFSKQTYADASYDWGMPIIGLSNTVLNNPKYADPYDNADKTAVILDSSSGPGYISRAKICFGSTISKETFAGTSVWSTLPATKPDIYSSEYAGAKCGQETDDSWNRVVAFVNSSSAMEAEACRLGNEDSCARLGQDSPVGTTSAAPATTSNPTAIDNSALFSSSTSIACYDDPATPTAETRDIGIYDGYWKYVKIPIRLCAIPGFKSTSEESNGGYGVTGANGEVIVNSRVSKNIYTMFTDAKKGGLTLAATSSFRTMAHSEALCPCDGTMVSKPGNSNHQMGIAIDFKMRKATNSGAKVCATDRAKSVGDPTWEWLEHNAARYGYHQLMYESWHWDPIPVPSRCGGDAGA